MGWRWTRVIFCLLMLKTENRAFLRSKKRPQSRRVLPHLKPLGIILETAYQAKHTIPSKHTLRYVWHAVLSSAWLCVLRKNQHMISSPEQNSCCWGWLGCSLPCSGGTQIKWPTILIAGYINGSPGPQWGHSATTESDFTKNLHNYFTGEEKKRVVPVQIGSVNWNTHTVVISKFGFIYLILHLVGRRMSDVETL
jgi:hypothetical protein